MDIGIIQGRLLPPIKGRIQAFPRERWTEEFFIAKDIGLNSIDWIIEDDRGYPNPLLKKDGQDLIMKISEETGIIIQSVCADLFMDFPILRGDENREKFCKDKLLTIMECCQRVGIKYIEMTKPFGYVPENATFSWEDVQESDGTMHQYLVADNCILWTGRYPEVNKVIETGTGQSMEININDGEYTDDDYLNVKAFTFSALCLLGDNFEPCFEGSKAVGYTFNKDDFESEYQEMLGKIKQFSLDSLNNNTNNKEEKLMDKLALFAKYTNLTDEDTKVLKNNLDKYSLEELDIELMKLSYTKMEKEFTSKIVDKDNEITTLTNDLKEQKDTVFTLNTELTELKEKYTTLEITATELKETNEKYENEKLATKKEAMFEKFSKALSEEDMKEIKEKMSEYSVEDIENKLNAIFTNKTLESLKDEKDVIDNGHMGFSKKSTINTKYCV
jgi:hypothetical protein